MMDIGKQIYNYGIHKQKHNKFISVMMDIINEIEIRLIIETTEYTSYNVFLIDE